MDFGISEEQALLKNSVDRYLDDHASLDVVRDISNGSNTGQPLWSGLCELGIAGILIPEAHGGVGLSGMDAGIVAECLGFHASPAPFLGTAVVAPLVFLASQKRTDLLEMIAAGQHTVGLAFSEAVGSRTNSELQWNGEVLNGKSAFVLDFSANSFLLATKDHQLLLIDSNAKGLTKSSIPHIDKTRPSGELVYDNTPAELISEDPGVYFSALDAARIMLAADTLGAAQNMLNQAVSYAGQREQFGRVIASFQAVKHMCAEMAAQLEPCRAMVWYAGHTISALPDELRLTACHTKAHLSEVGQFVARTSTEVHGGMGFTDLLGLHYWFKRIGYNRQMLGSPELLREEAAFLQGLVTH